jgi:MATE family multidrug resistance protein
MTSKNPSLNKQILSLAIPNMVSNISIPMLGMVDTALMGHLPDLKYVAAVALGSMIFNMIYWSIGFLRTGTLGFTGQALGKGDDQEVSNFLYRSIFLALASAVILIVLHPWLIQWALQLTNSSWNIEIEAKKYFDIRIWALPASLSLMSLSGWLIGLQNTKLPMLLAIASNILNISFSFILVVFLNLNTTGVALGSVIAQYITLGIALIFIKKKYQRYLKPLDFSMIFDVTLIKLIKVNGDLFIRTLGLMLVFSYFTLQSANIGDVFLAANSILFQFFILFSYMLDGFANAAESLTSLSIGSKNKILLRKVIGKSFLFGFFTSLIFTILYAFLGKEILYLITDNSKIIVNTLPLIGWIVLIPIISFPAFIFDGIFVGATASKAMRNGMIASVLIIFFPLLYLLPFDPMVNLWVAFLSFMLSRSLFLGLYLKKHVLQTIA